MALWLHIERAQLAAVQIAAAKETLTSPENRGEFDGANSRRCRQASCVRNPEFAEFAGVSNQLQPRESCDQEIQE